MSENDVLQLRGVTVFQNKRNLLAADRLPTLIGMTECIDPSTRPWSLSRHTDNQKSAAGVQSDDAIQPIHIRLNGTRVFAVNGKVQERRPSLSFVLIPKFVQLAVNLTEFDLGS